VVGVTELVPVGALDSVDAVVATTEVSGWAELVAAAELDAVLLGDVVPSVNGPVAIGVVVATAVVVDSGSRVGLSATRFAAV